MRSRKKTSSAASRRPGAASCAPTAAISARAAASARTMQDLGQLADAGELPRRGAARTRPPAPRSRPCRRARRESATGRPRPRAAPRREDRVRGERRVVQAQVVGEDAEHVASGRRPSAARPGRSPRPRGARRRRNAVRPSCSVRGSVPAWSAVGQPVGRGASAAVRGVGVGPRPRASCQSARSISVVTLCGSPRRTAAVSVPVASAPSSRTARASMREAGGGGRAYPRQSGTTSGEELLA